MGFGLIASAAVSIGKHLIGGHLVQNKIAGVPSAAFSLLGGFGIRSALVFFGTLYATQPTVRTAIDGLIAAVTKVFI